MGILDRWRSRKTKKTTIHNKDNVANNISDDFAKKILLQRYDELKKVHTKNAAVSNLSGMGSACDMSVGTRALLDQPQTFIEQLQQAEILYYSDWQSQKTIDLPVDDMLREEWKYLGFSEEQISKINRRQHDLKFHQTLRQALKTERLHGGSMILLGLDSQTDDLESAINYSEIGVNSLRFLNVIPRYRISRLVFNNDPLSSSYGRPSHYLIDAKSVHHTRLLIFNGDPLLPIQPSTFSVLFGSRNDGFGFPVLIRIFNALIHATGTRQTAFHLLQKASRLILKGGWANQLSTSEGTQKMADLQNIILSLNNYGAAFLDSMPGSEVGLEDMGVNLAGTSDLIDKMNQIVAAAADIPVTRFLAQSPGGLSATGLSDLENYYNNISSKQQNRLKPILMEFLRVLIPSIPNFGTFDLNEIDIEFPPLWNSTAIEDAQVRTSDTTNILGMVNTGIISDDQALEELSARDVLLTNSDDFDAPTLISDEEISDDKVVSTQDLLSDLKRKANDADNTTQR